MNKFEKLQLFLFNCKSQSNPQSVGVWNNPNSSMCNNNDDSSSDDGKKSQQTIDHDSLDMTENHVKPILQLKS